ncbi:acyltransferase family protein [Paludibaculum fermentans]|uniref:acyltransferase family protein n=1 Tax=Paludibaculum fermentans TaxID=1473598 RepID=UPI003EC049D3
MAAGTIPATNAAHPGPMRPEQGKSARLVSLDVYRGFIMLMLVSGGFGFGVLQAYPGWSWLAVQVEHAAWEGCTFWDLIQPAFTFMVGMAMPYSLGRRAAAGDPWMRVMRHVVWRALVLIILSNVYSSWGAKPGQLRLQFINVLCQIAFGYVLCALILRLPFRSQVAAAVAIFAGYWGLFVAFPGPQGPWSQTGNIGAVLDLQVLGYNYSGYYTTINFVGNALTILFGCWAGLLLQSDRSHASRLKILGGCAAACLALGLALQPFIPMVKRLWTGSFLLFSTGWVVLMLMAFYWVIEVKQVKRWTMPFLVLGMNSIFVYSLGQIGISGWLNRGLASFTGNFAFLGDLGAIPQKICVLAGLWYLCYWLYQRRVFLKI